jgi:hypothetical protein
MATQFTQDEVQKFNALTMAQVDSLPVTQQMRYLEWRKSILQSSLPQATVNGKTIKIHDSGTISFYGFGKFPVNVRLNALTDIMEIVKTESFKQLIAQNMGKLVKPE